MDREEALIVLNRELSIQIKYEKTEISLIELELVVPNQKNAVSGAQPLESFSQELEKVWKEEHTLTKFEMLTDDNL